MDLPKLGKRLCDILGEESLTVNNSVDVIATTSQQLEQGFDKIARWCSLEFRQFVRDVPLEVNTIMTEAVRWLWKRPELLKFVLPFRIHLSFTEN